MGGRTWEEWIRQYSESHQDPVNRVCPTVGIPMIAVAIPLGVAGLWWSQLALAAAALFVVGWAFQFVGHAFEGKPPEFFKDWRYLLVGLRWWVAKVSGRA